MRSYTSTYRVEIHYPLNGWVVVVIGGNPARGLGPRQANRLAEDQRRHETHYARLNCPARRVRVVHEQTGAKLWAAPAGRKPAVEIPAARIEESPAAEPRDGTLFPGSQVCRRISGPSRSSSNTPRLF